MPRSLFFPSRLVFILGVLFFFCFGSAFSQEINFTTSPTSGDESVATATLNLTISPASASDIILNFSVGGLADNGVDYTITSSPLNIPAGNTTATIVINVADDGSNELDETVIVSLDSASIGTIGSSNSHTYTILDNDVPVIEFTTSPVSDDESTTPVNLNLTVNPASISAIDLTFDVIGTAENGVDYTVSSSPLSIPAGNTTATIVLNVSDDSLHEDNETVIVDLISATSGSIGTADSHTYTINDNDPLPVVGFTASTSSAAESAGSANIEVSLSAASGLPVSVDYTVIAGGSATGGGVDYTLDPDTVTIPAGSTSANISIAITEDTIVEGAETVLLSLSSPTDATLGTSAHTFTIDDNDVASIVQFASSASSGDESVSPAELTVNITPPAIENIELSFSVGGAATGGGIDYSVPGSPIIIPSGSSTYDLSLTVIDDALDEANETVAVTLTGVTNATLGSTLTHTYTINDNDALPVVGFGQATSNADESAGSVNIPVTLSAVSGLAVSVDYAVTNGSATGGGVDYTLASGTLNYPAGTTSRNITITLVDDGLVEGAENVVITLSGPSNASLGTNPHTFTINDNDVASVVAFSTATSSGGEGTTPANLEVTISPASSSAINLSFSVAGSASGSGVDYSAPASPINIPAGNASWNIPLTVVDDTLDEANETVAVTLTGVTNATLGSTLTHTYTINDNDALPVVGFGQATSNADESAGTVNIPVILSAASGLAVSVDYAVTNGSATGGGVDYTLASGTLSFSPGVTSRNIPIIIVNDTISEGNETVVVTLSSPSNASLGTNPHTFTIIDNDTTTVGFDQGTSSGNESAGTVNIPVTLSTSSALTVTVDYAVTGGTATPGGVDFTLASGTLSFSPGATSRNIPIAIVNDTISEGNETVVVTLSSPSNASLGTNPHTFTIIDNDTTTVGFDQGTSSANESAGTVNIPVTLSTSSALTVTVDYAVTGGTATPGGVDYTLASGTLSFSPGATSRNIPITIVDDGIAELSETVVITLSNPSNATIGTNPHTVTLIDNDDTSVGFSQGTSNADEDAGTVNIAVTLSAQSSQEVTVDYDVTGGTATGGGADYTLANGTLTFTSGTTNRNIPITINDDLISEVAETVQITLSNPNNASLGLALHTFTINDNDEAQVRFAQSASSVDESAGSASITVTLSAQSSQEIEVDYAVTGGTATGGGTDYTLVNGTLNYPPGTSSRNITVTIVEDPISEGSETVQITLSNPVNATLGTSLHTLTINDNDDLQFETNVLQIVVPEGGTESFFVKLTAQPLTNVIATVSRVSGDKDLTVLSGASLTFTPGNWDQNQEVVIQADEDPDVSDGNATFRISASGLDPKDILATEQDDALINGEIQLVVSSQEGTSGTPVGFAVEISDNKSSVSSFEFDFLYDDSIFNFEGSGPGTLTSNWSLLTATETSPGTIEVQGTSGGGTAIPAFSNGSVIAINLQVKCLNLTSVTNTQILTNNYIGGFIEYSPEPYTALFTYRPCDDLGDVNADGGVTPGDAQRAFEIYLGRLAPNFCQRMTSDANCGGTTTPGDAQWIFEHFLGRRTLPTCCAEAPATSVHAENPRPDDDMRPGRDIQASRSLFALDTIGISGEVVSIPIVITNPQGIRSFGFDLVYPPGLLEFLGTGPCLLTDEFEFVAAAEQSKGLIRVDGESQIPIQSTETGSLVVLVFRVRKGGDTRLPLNIISSSGDILTAMLKDGFFTRIREDWLDTRLLRFGEAIHSEDGTVTVPVKVSSAFNMKSFGLVLEYATDNLTFLGVEKAKLSEDFIALDGSEMEPGVVRVGGYSMSALQELSPGTLFHLIFAVTGGGGEIEMTQLLDDLQFFTIHKGIIAIH